MPKFKKLDLILALAIGISSALMMIFVGRNLSEENDFLKTVVIYDKYVFTIFPLLCVLWIIATRFASNFIGKTVYQFGKFTLTGGFNFLLDAAILNFFIFATSVTSGLPQTGFKSVSFVFGATSSYLLNKYWTFSIKTKTDELKYVYKFFMISGIGFAINVGVDYFFVNMIGSFWNMKPALWAQFSAVLAAVIAMVWNFMGYKFFVFKERLDETK